MDRVPRIASSSKNQIIYTAEKFPFQCIVNFSPLKWLSVKIFTAGVMILVLSYWR